MPNWANLMLTKKGKALQAKAVAGAQLTITKMKLGSGTIPDGTSPEDLNDLIDPKQNLGLTAIEAQGNLAKIQSLITNADLADGYYIRECGVFAQDPDLGEILYAIMTDTAPDFLPPSGGSVVISEEFSINIAMENVSHITAIIDPDGLATVTNAKKIAADAVAAHNTAESVHGENIASKEEAEAKTNLNNSKFMTPLRVKQAMGTMTFIDLLPVGWVSYKEFLLPQHVKANGATVNRSDYPSLAAYATEHNLWTDDPASEPYKYGRCDGGTTMVLPDFRNRVIQGGDNVLAIAAGLPNIEGYFTKGPDDTTSSDESGIVEYVGGSFIARNVSTRKTIAPTGSKFTLANGVTLDASKSSTIYGNADTVQPPAIVLIPQIKY